MRWLRPQKVTVFVSSTLAECATERASARSAIETISCEPIMFDAIGARPHPPRASYLAGLERSMMCVSIWKESYGYIDPALQSGMSGIEDEFQRARELGLDILLYVKKDAPGRDPRLQKLIKSAEPLLKIYFYRNESDLGEQIKEDLSLTISQDYIDRFAPSAQRLVDAEAMLRGIIPLQSAAIKRPTLVRKISDALQKDSVVWLIGAPGSGKTVLAAQWAAENQVPYVNARGLEPRRLYQVLGSALAGQPIHAEAAITAQAAIESLREIWVSNTVWPVVLDDPEITSDFLSLIGDLIKLNKTASLIIATRKSTHAKENIVEIPSLSTEEVEEVIAQLPEKLRANVSKATHGKHHVVPLDIRRSAAEEFSPSKSFFDESKNNLGARPTELAAYIALSPEPLTLEALNALTPGSDGPVALDQQLTSLSYLIVDDGLGYRPVHDEIANDLKESLLRRHALYQFVLQRLARYFLSTKRFASAFQLFRQFDTTQALSTAYRAAKQAGLHGRFNFAVEPLEFIVNARREKGERLELTLVLLSLAQAYGAVGRWNDCINCYDEASRIAENLADKQLLQVVQDQRLITKVRRELKPEDLSDLRALRFRYAEIGNDEDSARLGAEEGSILVSVGNYEAALEPLRQARSVFLKSEDRHGIEITTRNLIASLNALDGNELEAEQLLRDLEDSASGFDELRHRAWMCNILTRRYRLDGQLDKAIAVANEAINIGQRLNDQYLITINRIGLGNALRVKGDLRGALDSFKTCSKEANDLGRRDVDGLASRLAASVLVQMGEEADETLKKDIFREAELFATHSIALLKGSIADHQVPDALETRAGARLNLGNKNEARFDYAEAIRKTIDDRRDEVPRLMRQLVHLVDSNAPAESMLALLCSLEEIDNQVKEAALFDLLIRLMKTSALKAERLAVGFLFGAALQLLQTAVDSSVELGLWLRLISLSTNHEDAPSDGRLSFILMAFLAHTRHRTLSTIQMSALADQTIVRDKNIGFHKAINGPQQISVKLGLNDGILLVFDDMDSSEATRYVAVALTSFFSAFRAEINSEFFSSNESNSVQLQLTILDFENAPADLKTMLSKINSQLPIIIAQPSGIEDRQNIIIVCRSDVQERTKGNLLQATELQFMYADVLRAVLDLIFGGKLDPEIMRPKIVQLVRKTIQ